MNPCHVDINWTNNQTPAINDTNLGQINTELREIDTRVCSLANDPAGEALVSEGWAEGTQDGVPVTSGSPYYQNNSDYHRLESEGWANGEQDGVPVTSGSPYYENNAKYWKEQAAAIAGQTLDGLTDVNITTPADGQALVYDSNSSEWVNGNVGSQTTNPNLLYNPWFTVNQRGWTSGSSTHGKYCVDRWRMTFGSSAGTIALSSSGLTLTPASVNDTVTIIQPFEDDLFNSFLGKTLTASVLLSNGTIKSGTKTITTLASSTTFITAEEGVTFNVLLQSSSKGLLVNGLSTGVTIRAVKLEIGSTSTLHLDTAPDYTTELLKCQRYFYRLKLNAAYGSLGMAFALSATDVRSIIPLPTEMRTTPTMTTSGTFWMAYNGANYNLSSLTYTSSGLNNAQIKGTPSTSLTPGACGILACGSTSEYIDFSAEL